MSVADADAVRPVLSPALDARAPARRVGQYPPGLQIIVVDDGSPEPAREVLALAEPHVRAHLRLYRIGEDIPWNRSGARNLAAMKATTDWVCMADLDHVLPAAAAAHLLEFEPQPEFWYRLRRYRNGRADETRMKDMIPREQEFGEVKPHIDSYVITRDMYWSVGGYDEDFAGCLGRWNGFPAPSHSRLWRAAHAAGRHLPACLHARQDRRCECHDAVARYPRGQADGRSEK